jgi:hypothetical protein
MGFKNRELFSIVVVSPTDVFVIIAALFLLTIPAYAEEHLLSDKMVGIRLSNTCITLLKNNLTTNCPSYSDLLSLDSSNRQISGDFVTENGFLKRTNPKYENHWKFYSLKDDYVIFIDPPTDIFGRIKIITITPQLTFFSPTLESGSVQDRLILKFGRFVNESCDNATITAVGWLELLPDTIFYMRKNCEPTMTKYELSETITKERHKPDITTSPNKQYEFWVKEMLERCKQRGC